MAGSSAEASEAARRQRRQLAYALRALKMYNPDFALTPEVLEIMRAFFADLRPDAHGTITRTALVDAIARLDPSAESRVRRDITDERLDFAAFCEYVMRWKAQSPQVVQSVYTSWASQIAALDYGMSEGDSLFLDLKDARMARNIYVHDGFHALFRGNMLNIFRVIPYAGLQHSGFDFFRHKFHAYNYRKAERESSQEVPKLSNLQLVAAGSLAGGLSLVVAYPLDIVRARYMVQMGKHRYTSIYEAVLTMYKVDGARSFSRGLVPSLLGTLPYTGIGFSLNERFKIWRRRMQVQHGENAPEPSLNPLTKFVCSYFAACIAQTSTYPMDTIRRRIQTDGYVSGSQVSSPLRELFWREKAGEGCSRACQ
uniref:EF-hand domain-containing protein n=1 Tax=Phytophthora ramorum TaxID=164328 RepID=H3H8U5_PHYRM